MKIIFGSRRLGIEDGASSSNQKYPDFPVVTIEAAKSAGKSRRILFNSKASEALGLENGFIQELSFGAVINDADGEGTPENTVLVGNAANISHDIVKFKTSKNAVSFEGSKEKGKAVTSSRFAKELIEFLNLDDTAQHEFRLNEFNNEELEVFSLTEITNSSDLNESDDSIQIEQYDTNLSVEVNDAVEEVDSSFPIRKEVAETTNY